MDKTEYLKCAGDFVYFCEKYIKVKHPKRGLIAFDLLPFQKSVIKEYQNQRFILLKKFRQGGFSTLTVMYALWDCLFSLDKRWLFISKSDREARYLSGFVKSALEQLPYDLRTSLTVDNEHSKKFSDTNCEMQFFSPVAAKGRAVTNLVIDEAAFIPGMEEYWKAVYPTVSTGGQVFVLSTPNGNKNWFYNEWKDAAEGKNMFKTIAVPYTEHPEYRDEAFVKMLKTNLGEKAFQQEFEGRFSYEPKAMQIICEILDEEAL